MRINNLSARLLINERLVEVGREAFPPDLPYEQFADKLRAITATTMAQAKFLSRADAVAYIRLVAQNRFQMIQAGGSKPAQK